MSSSNGHAKLQDVGIHFDAVKQTVTFKQKQNAFAIKADEVTVPVVAIEAIYSQLLTQRLAAQGVQAGQINVAVPKADQVRA